VENYIRVNGDCWFLDDTYYNYGEFRIEYAKKVLCDDCETDMVKNPLQIKGDVAYCGCGNGFKIRSIADGD
jgi:superfamily II helicase